MRKPLATVTTLYETNARQIPEMLRKVAGEIESPPVPDVKIDQAVFIMRDSATGRLNVYGWGDVSIEASALMLAIASKKLADLADGGDLWVTPECASAPKDSGNHE